MTKVLSNVMLVLPNMIVEPSNVKKKKKNETKEQSYVMLKLDNVRLKLSSG